MRLEQHGFSSDVLFLTWRDIWTLIRKGEVKAPWQPIIIKREKK